MVPGWQLRARQIFLLFTAIGLGLVCFWERSLGAEPAITVTYHGGAEGVAGTLALVETSRATIGIDCGAFYPEEGATKVERDRLAALRNQALPSASLRADAFIITHAHADHIGRLPLLVRSGYKRAIFMTEATRSLAEIMLEMTLRWDEAMVRNWMWSKARGKAYVTAHWNNCEWSQRILTKNCSTWSGTLSGLRMHIAPREVSPCRTCARLEVAPIMQLVRTESYGHNFAVTGGITAQFISAGHIPGSASILLTIDQGAGLPTRRVLFSGDVGNNDSALTPEPEIPPEADLVFIESTYGATRHGAPGDRVRATFRAAVIDALKAKKVVWIPAFALDRTQKILHELELIRRDNGPLMVQVPIHVSSPSGREFTEAYTRHVNQGWFRPGIDARSFATAKLDRFPNVSDVKGPCVLITTSGMMDEAASNDLIDQLALRVDVQIFLVGYQDPFSEGAQIRDHRTVNIDGREIRVSAQVQSFPGFSAHGRADDLNRWLSCQRRDTHIGLVHGSPEALRDRKEDLVQQGYQRVDIPRNGERVELAVPETKRRATP